MNRPRHNHSVTNRLLVLFSLIPLVLPSCGCSKADPSWQELLGQGKAIRTDDSMPVEERWARAEVLYLEALRKLECAPGGEPLKTAEMRELFNEIESVFFSQGKNAELEPIYRKKIAIFERYLGKDSTLSGSAHEGLGHLYKKTGRTEMAAAEYGAALAVYRRQGRDEGAERMRAGIRALGHDPNAIAGATSPSSGAPSRQRAATQPGSHPSAGDLPAEPVPCGFFALPNQPHDLSAAACDRLLAGEPPAYRDGVHTRSGPLAVQLDASSGTLDGWKGERRRIPFVTLHVRLVDLPLPGPTDMEIGVATIRRIVGRGGADLHDTSVAPEQDLSFDRETTPRSHLASRCNAYLTPGAEAADVTRIEGTIRLRLPIGLRVFEVAPLEDRAAVPADTGIRLDRFSLSGDTVELSIAGELNRWFGLRARDSRGRLLIEEGFMGGSTADQAQYGIQFGGTVSTVEAFIAKGIAERTFDFTLSR